MNARRRRPAPDEGRSGLSAPQQAFLDISASRIRRIAETIHHPGSALVLTGEPGCGKSYLAQAATYAFEARLGQPIERVVLNSSDDLIALCVDAASFSTQEASEKILGELESRAAGRELLVVAFGLDLYRGEHAVILEHLVRARRVRFIGTARQITQAADRLARNPGVHQLAVQPLSIDETNAFLSRILGVENLSPRTLQRWHTSTYGNQHALVTLAICAERRGAVRRARKVAWVSGAQDETPIDFIKQLGTLSAAEQESLELVAYATPLHEPALLQLLDGDAVNQLLSSQVLAVRTDASGITALSTRLPIVAAAIRTHLSPVRRAELAAKCFHAINANADQLSTLSTSNRLRLVRFGIEGGCEIPVDWVWLAMRASARSGDLHFVLGLALTAMHHENPQRAAEAIRRACDLAKFLGEREALQDALAALIQLQQEEHRFKLIEIETQVVLVLTAICFDSTYSSDPDRAMVAFNHWEATWSELGYDVRRAVQACRMRILTLNGQLRRAFDAGLLPEGPHDLEAEWISAPAHTYEAILRVQRGEFRAALELAETTRQIMLLHDISPTISGDLEGFSIFLAHWARGTTQATKRTLEALIVHAREDLTAVHARAGLLDLALVLFALQEARWYEAADLADRLIESLAPHDPFGVGAMAHAASALAIAALGDDESASDALRRCELRDPGLSFALRGFVESLKLRALHWLRDPDLASRALALADWAREEGLALIELQALDIMAHEIATPDPVLLERATQIATAVDAPLGDAILAHIRALTKDETSAAEPEERLLSELGVWLPLPPVSGLTGREREIALFTALGYPSKHIAERLHLSARTIETHLAHVYTKLGLNGREELRRWFSRRREDF